MSEINAAVIAARWIAESEGSILHDKRIGATQARNFRLDPEVMRVLRGMSGMERLRLAHEAWELARDQLTVSLTATHPDWSSDRVRQAVAERMRRPQRS